MAAVGASWRRAASAVRFSGDRRVSAHQPPALPPGVSGWTRPGLTSRIASPRSSTGHCDRSSRTSTGYRSTSIRSPRLRRRAGPEGLPVRGSASGLASRCARVAGGPPPPLPKGGGAALLPARHGRRAFAGSCSCCSASTSHTASGAWPSARSADACAARATAARVHRATRGAAAARARALQAAPLAVRGTRPARRGLEAMGEADRRDARGSPVGARRPPATRRIGATRPNRNRIRCATCSTCTPTSLACSCRPASGKRGGAPGARAARRAGGAGAHRGGHPLRGAGSGSRPGAHRS